MTTVQNINSLILANFATGLGAAGYLRGRIPGLAVYIEDFFTTRSDIERIQKAEQLSERILSLTDFTDFVQLRSEVATIEIKRLINYKKQSDHTAHTVYLFLLGIWVYDHIIELRQRIDSFIESKVPMKMFIFQWTFSSLLHDIGYLFYNFEEGHNVSSFRLYDEMFSYGFIERFAGKLSDSGREQFRSLWSEFVEKFGEQRFSDRGTALDLVVGLDSMPWLPELGVPCVSGLEAMTSAHYRSPELTEFATHMAKTGYNGTPVVDHGVASSLMLVKYTSVWYWLSARSKEKFPTLWGELNAQFQYIPELFRKHVIPACRAVAYHNVPGMKFSLEKEPLVYLSVVCDELQVWDRFLSGEQHIDNWRTINHCTAEKIHGEVVLGESGEAKLHIITSNPHSDKLLESLEKRVEEWWRFVQITNRDK